MTRQGLKGIGSTGISSKWMLQESAGSAICSKNSANFVLRGCCKPWGNNQGSAHQPFHILLISYKALFLIFRDIRDKIYHGGYATNLIFCDGDGFAIQNTEPTFSELNYIWPKEKIKENGLVSLLALFSYITKQIIENLDDLSLALIKSIEIKPSISSTHKVFFRGPYINHLNNLDKYLSEQWYVPTEH